MLTTPSPDSSKCQTIAEELKVGASTLSPSKPLFLQSCAKSRPPKPKRVVQQLVLSRNLHLRRYAFKHSKRKSSQNYARNSKPEEQALLKHANLTGVLRPRARAYLASSNDDESKGPDALDLTFSPGKSPTFSKPPKTGTVFCSFMQKSLRSERRWRM